jgi:hypothetical protein
MTKFTSDFKNSFCKKVAQGLPGPQGLSPVMLRASFLIFGSIFVHPFASHRHRYSFMWLLSGWVRRLLLPVFPEKDHLHLTDSGSAVFLCLKVNISSETGQKKKNQKHTCNMCRQLVLPVSFKKSDGY